MFLGELHLVHGFEQLLGGHEVLGVLEEQDHHLEVVRGDLLLQARADRQRRLYQEEVPKEQVLVPDSRRDFEWENVGVNGDNPLEEEDGAGQVALDEEGV